LYETEVSEKIGMAKTNNRNYDYASDSYAYLPERTNAAIFPLLKTGEQPKVWPSRGGSEQGRSSERVRNEPIRPSKPSITLPATP
jgi:hypothetical protein